jgi:Phage tail tube protein
MVATSSNRRQIAAVVEVTMGTTPGTPRMRQKLVTGESLKYAPTFTDSAEIRSDRMTSDSIQTGLDSAGACNWELHYPFPDSYEDWDIRSAMFNSWVNTPVRDNDGVADSQITDIGTVANTITVLTSAGTQVNTGTFAIGHLVRTTGFATAGNNRISILTGASSTTAVASAAGWVAEAAPPAAARVKVVGFGAGSGDITATATGLASTTLDFTTLGLAVGQWLKIGATATGNRFATAACNGRIRITAVAAHAITADNLPSGWTTDAGTGKAIYVWFGDRIINGTTTVSQTIERGDLGQATPVYIVQTGMVVSQFQMQVRPKQIVTGTTTYMGMTGSQSTTTLDAAIDSAPALTSYPQFGGSANVGRVNEYGAQFTSPNWCTQFDMSIANNLAAVECVDAIGPQDLVPGECTVTGSVQTIFGDNSVLSRFFNATPTSLSIVFQRNTQALFVTLPRVTLNSDGSPNAGGKNQIITVSFGYRASKDDTLTNSLVSFDRLEYFET